MMKGILYPQIPQQIQGNLLPGWSPTIPGILKGLTFLSTFFFSRVSAHLEFYNHLLFMLFSLGILMGKFGPQKPIFERKMVSSIFKPLDYK